MDQAPHASGRGRLRDGARAVDMNGLVALVAVLVGNADGVDHGLASGNRRRDRPRHTHISAHQHHLTDVARGLDRLSEFNAPGHHSHQIALLRQCPDNRLADEARTAKNRDLLDLHGGRYSLPLTSGRARRTSTPRTSPACPAQVAELVDALVSGTSSARRGSSSLLLGTMPGVLERLPIEWNRQAVPFDWKRVVRSASIQGIVRPADSS